MSKISKKRYVDTKFWVDNYIVERDPIEKLLYLYLLTNTLTNILGIYEISVRQIAFDTGIDKDMVIKILERFKKDNKIRYIDGYIAIKKFVKYQADNPKINKGIELLLKEVPIDLIEWIDIDFNRLDIKKDSLSIGLDKTSSDSNYSNSNSNSNTNTNTNTIFTHWNEQNIIVHKNIENYSSPIKASLKKHTESEIITSITNYHTILIGEQYYFKYKWTLNDFLKRGIDKFLDLEIAKNNYNKGTTKQSVDDKPADNMPTLTEHLRKGE